MASKTDYVPFLNVPLSDALFTVDTRDGLKSSNGLIINPQSPYEINIQKSQQLFSGAVQRIALTEVNMPWNIPNVNWRNNILYLEKDDGTTAEWTPGAGYFTASELATAFETWLTTSVDGGIFGVDTWTVVFNEKGSYFLVNPNNADLLWRVNPKIGQAKGKTPFTDGTLVSRSSTLAEMMGFNFVNSDFINVLDGSYASMLYTTYVDIVSSVLCKNQDVRDTSTSYFTGNNILARIYISPSTFYPITDGTTTIGTRPFMLHYVFPVPKEIQWNPEEFLASCNIRIQDDKGDLLYGASTVPFTNEEGTEYAGNSSWVQMNMLISEAGSIKGKYSVFN